MSALHKRLYATLFGRVEETMEYINNEIVSNNAYDWNHTREVLLKLQAALQECEDMYVDAE